LIFRPLVDHPVDEKARVKLGVYRQVQTELQIGYRRQTFESKLNWLLMNA